MTGGDEAGAGAGPGARPGLDASGAAPGYDAFYRANLEGLRRLAHGRTGDWPAAEDLVQDVLADAYRRWDRLATYDDPVAWARRAVLNRSVSRWRRRSRETAALARLGRRRPTAVAPEAVLTDTELWDRLRRLPPRQLQVALLLWFEELTVAEVAAVLECAPDTVRTHWRRARARLAAELGEVDPAAGDDDEVDPAADDEDGAER